MADYHLTEGSHTLVPIYYAEKSWWNRDWNEARSQWNECTQ